MGYAITIRRERPPAITREEWTAAVRADPALVPGAGADSCSWKDDEGCAFFFNAGVVTIENPTEGWERIIGEVAARLNAVAVGDDGERYLPDGTVVGEPPREAVKRHLPDWVAFVLAVLGVIGLFAWFGVAVWLFGYFRIGGWGALIGLACVAASRLRWREELVREGLLAFGGTTALAGVISWLYALIRHGHGAS